MLIWINIIGAVAIVVILAGFRLLYQYERGVVFTLGKFSGVKEPGLRWIIPAVQTMRKIDMRIKTADIPRQEVMTKDNISILANAVVYFKVEKPADVVIKIEDFEYAVRQYTQTAIRDVFGNYELDFVLTEREKIAESIKKIVDAETSGWGVDIESIKIQELEMPAEMKRAMAKQAESEREKRAMIITAEGELKAAENLQKAAAVLGKSPVAIQLRTLQTIRDIASDPSEKIILFMPSDAANIVKQFVGKK
jgi:regulator of protease activity HflC (stomatin/prohibitin superfamily)